MGEWRRNSCNVFPVFLIKDFRYSFSTRMLASEEATLLLMVVPEICIRATWCSRLIRKLFVLREYLRGHLEQLSTACSTLNRFRVRAFCLSKMRRSDAG